MILKIKVYLQTNTKINHLIAQHIIDTSNAEYKEMINQSVDNNKQENKFKNVSDDFDCISNIIVCGDNSVIFTC